MFDVACSISTVIKSLWETIQTILRDSLGMPCKKIVNYVNGSFDIIHFSTVQNCLIKKSNSMVESKIMKIYDIVTGDAVICYCQLTLNVTRPNSFKIGMYQ